MPKDSVTLTRKGYETLLGLCRGRTAQQIASEHGVPYCTVKARLRQLYTTLGVGTAFGAIVQSWRLGVLHTCPVCRRTREGGMPMTGGFRAPGTTSATYELLEPDVPELEYEDVAGEPGAELIGTQLETLRMLASGYSYEEMATALDTTMNAVNSRIYRLYRTLGVHDRVDATAIGFMKGYVQEEHILHYRQGK